MRDEPSPSSMVIACGAMIDGTSMLRDRRRVAGGADATGGSGADEVAVDDADEDDDDDAAATSFDLVVFFGDPCRVVEATYDGGGMLSSPPSSSTNAGLMTRTRGTTAAARALLTRSGVEPATAAATGPLATASLPWRCTIPPRNIDVVV
jgi:hypothetical protein